MKNKNLEYWGVLFIGFWAVQGTAFAENKAEELELGTVDVVATTPLPSLGTPLEEVPANVQTIKADQIKKQKPSNLGEFMGNNLGTVNISNSTGNPYQMDVSYRGFTASPILGTPSGMSVFLDGVRFNEPFGDYVNWDLIPMNAVSSVNLIPGSNPLFGLNALGGSIAVMTKSGATYKGGQATVTAGSWGRKAGQFEYGGEDKERGIDYYFSANSFSEDGWRPHNSSRINQVFSKVGWHDDRSDLDLSVALADNTMQGTQGTPLSMLRVNRAQSYTYPDIINNKMALIALKGSHFISDEKLVTANVYYRMSNATNFNSNAACDDTGCPSYTINGSPDPAYAGTGAIVAQNVASRTYQDGFGGSMQYSYLGDMLGHANKLTVGASADLSRIKFSQDSLGADLVNYQTLTDPAQGLQNAVRLKNHTDYYGLYATDNFTFNEKVNVTVSGRYNIARTNLSGANTDYTTAPASATSLNGNHKYERFNPAIGLTYNPSKSIGFYGGYNEGMRVPTPVELTCSNPNIPCSLPTGFNSDPSLKKIVAKTWEGGVRGKFTNDIGWNAGVYETKTDNEIEFIYYNNNQGIFQNVGQTLRRGIELGLNGKIDKWTLSANYGFVDATFQSGFQLSAPANSAADANGAITVHKGNHIPGVAKQTLKFRAAYDVNEDWYIGSNVILIAGQYPYGDQNNQDVNGKVPGYAVVNLDSSYKISSAWTASLIVTNLFDKSYATFGQLGNNIYTGGTPEQFRTPAAPRGAWLSVSYQFGGETANKKRDVD